MGDNHLFTGMRKANWAVSKIVSDEGVSPTNLASQGLITSQDTAKTLVGAGHMNSYKYSPHEVLWRGGKNPVTYDISFLVEY